jgi:hypothetical protein
MIFNKNASDLSVPLDGGLALWAIGRGLSEKLQLGFCKLARRARFASASFGLPGKRVCPGFKQQPNNGGPTVERSPHQWRHSVGICGVHVCPGPDEHRRSLRGYGIH